MLDVEYGIERCLITGISSINLANNTSGFNIAVNMSIEKEGAGLCGLPHTDV